MTVVVAAVIEADGRFLVTRRQPGVHLAGLWEFPGGKINPDEAHADALRRELREELDVDAEVASTPLYTTRHAYEAGREVELYFYRCTLNGMPRPLLAQEMRWVPREELRSLEFPPADAELLALLTASAAG